MHNAQKVINRTIKISGNTIFIPGTSGIGLGLALRFHAAGNKVIIAGRREELLGRITAEHPGIEALVIDTTSIGQAAKDGPVALSRDEHADHHGRDHAAGGVPHR